MTALGPEQVLALSYIPAARRPGVEALWKLDAALGAVVSGSRDPMIRRIKLAWWREALEKLDREKAPAEPVLQAVSAHVLPAVSGSDLSELEEGWSVLLGEHALSAEELDAYARRGALLFRYTARLLGADAAPAVERGGETWALVDLARHSGEPDATAALEAARARLPESEAFRWPRALRPLGMLARLAARDAARGIGALEPPGAPKRMLQMLAHRFSGR